MMWGSEIGADEGGGSDDEGVDAEISFVTSDLLKAVRHIEELENENGEVENEW